MWFDLCCVSKSVCPLTQTLVAQIRQMPTWAGYVISLHPQTSTNKVYELAAESMKPAVFNNIKMSTI